MNSLRLGSLCDDDDVEDDDDNYDDDYYYDDTGDDDDDDDDDDWLIVWLMYSIDTYCPNKLYYWTLASSS